MALRKRSRTMDHQVIRLCSVPRCGRVPYARGLCQTHHGHLLKFGTIRRIRPYRKRRSDTVRISGLRVPRATAEKIIRHAHEQGISISHAVADLLERL